MSDFTIFGALWGSWLAGSGESLQLIGAVLNHSNISTTRIYGQLDLDPLRRALEQNASKMLLTVHKHFQRKEGRKHRRGSIPTPSLPALQRLVSAATNFSSVAEPALTVPTSFSLDSLSNRLH